jgi:hypothetical protein
LLVHGCFFPDIRGAAFLACGGPVRQPLLTHNASVQAMKLDKNESLAPNITTGDIFAKREGLSMMSKLKNAGKPLWRALPGSIQSFTGKAHP